VKLLRPRSVFISLVFTLQLLVLPLSAGPARWIGTWATAPLAEPADKEKLPLDGATLRQIVHVSLGGDTLRLRISNAFGETPLVLRGAHLALAAAGGATEQGTDHALTFAGQAGVTIPPGASYLSDPLEFALPPQGDVAISLLFDHVPVTLTMHGGSRTTSYLQAGDALAATALPDATKFTRWYFINGIDVVSVSPDAAALVVLGDSITDGHGTTTDGNDRWTDTLTRRIQQQKDLPPVGVLNLGIGGNRLLRDGLGPNALARFDRDVLGQAGARWLFVFEGINDIGTRIAARKHGADFASASDLIAAFNQIIDRAHAAGLRVLGATITPYRGADFYFTADGEADRQTINHWIRTSGRFDAVVDFDAALRDPAHPDRLTPEFDDDHLHPSLAGYRKLAETVDLSLLAR
jgi:lysophospholipase L1-like esterase